MGLQDQIKNHPMIIVAGAFAAGISIGWAVANSILVDPRNFEIKRLREELSKASALRQDLVKAQETIATFKKEFEIVQGIFEVYSDTFDEEVLKADTPVLVLFTATWSPPDLRFIPKYLTVYSEYRGRVKFVWIRLDRSPRIFKRYEIKAVPKLAMFKDGSIVRTTTGGLSERDLKSFIDRNL